MKQILKHGLLVALFAVAYLAIRFGLSLIIEDLPVKWDILSMLLVIVALTVVVITYAGWPDNLTFVTFASLMIFASGYLFWMPDGFASYSILAGAAFSALLFMICLFTYTKDISRKRANTKSIGEMFIILAIYLLFIPIIAAGEMFF